MKKIHLPMLYLCDVVVVLVNVFDLVFGTILCWCDSDSSLSSPDFFSDKLWLSQKQFEQKYSIFFLLLFVSLSYFSIVDRSVSFEGYSLNDLKLHHTTDFCFTKGGGGGDVRTVVARRRSKRLEGQRFADRKTK